MRQYAIQHGLMKKSEKKTLLISCFTAESQLFATDYLRFLLDIGLKIYNIQTVYEFQMRPVMKKYVLNLSEQRSVLHQRGDILGAELNKIKLVFFFV